MVSRPDMDREGRKFESSHPDKSLDDSRGFFILIVSRPDMDREGRKFWCIRFCIRSSIANDEQHVAITQQVMASVAIVLNTTYKLANGDYAVALRVNLKRQRTE